MGERLANKNKEKGAKNTMGFVVNFMVVFFFTFLRIILKHVNATRNSLKEAPLKLQYNKETKKQDKNKENKEEKKNTYTIKNEKNKGSL